MVPNRMAVHWLVVVEMEDEVKNVALEPWSDRGVILCGCGVEKPSNCDEVIEAGWAHGHVQ